MSELAISVHAMKRMNQRGISDELLHQALAYGRTYYGTGARFVYLAARDVPTHLRRIGERLEGLTLVFDSDTGVLLTVYKNKSGLPAIKRKSELSRRPGGRRQAPRRGVG